MHRTYSLVSALLLGALALIVPASAHADDASKRAKVEQMLALTKTDSISQNMLSTVPARVRAAAERQPMVQAATSPAQKKIADDYLQQMGTIAQGGTQWSALKPKVVDVYMSEFTEADLDGILAFFKTPAGQDYLAKSPDISQKTVAILQGSVSALEPQFVAATKAFQTTMQNTSPAGSGDAAPSRPPTLGPPTLQPRN